MAIATSTALAVGGLAITAATTTKSFIDAGKQRRLQKQAQADADRAMAEARKKLEVNVYDTMAVKKEPYELQREALLSQGAQSIQAGQESERGAAATAGKVQMAQNEAQAGIRTDMGKEMTDIEKLQLGEESRLRDIGVQLDLSEAEGAQQAAADAQQAAAAATTQAFQGVTSLASQGLQMVNLYPQDLKAQKEAISKMDASKLKDFGQVGGKDVDFGAVAKMQNQDYRAWKRQLNPKQKQMLYTNESYLSNYDPFKIYQ